MCISLLSIYIHTYANIFTHNTIYNTCLCALCCCCCSTPLHRAHFTRHYHKLLPGFVGVLDTHTLNVRASVTVCVRLSRVPCPDLRVSHALTLKTASCRQLFANKTYTHPTNHHTPNIVLCTYMIACITHTHTHVHITHMYTHHIRAKPRGHTLATTQTPQNSVVLPTRSRTSREFSPLTMQLYINTTIIPTIYNLPILPPSPIKLKCFAH